MQIQGNVRLSGKLIDFIKDFETPKKAILALLERDPLVDYPDNALSELLDNISGLCDEGLPWHRIVKIEPGCYTRIPKKRRNKTLLLFALRCDPFLIYWLVQHSPKDLTKDVWLEAIEVCPELIRVYKGKSEAVFIAAVKAKPQLISTLKNPSSKVCAAAVSEYMRRAVELSRVVKKWDITQII